MSSPSALDLVGAQRGRLAELFASGGPVDAGVLAGYEYDGISLGLPRWVERLTWLKFRKAFVLDPDSGHLRGWNVRVVQDGLDRPWRDAKDAAGIPRTFGHFRIVESGAYRIPRPCGASVLLDYGRAGNRALDPIAWLRDPLVSLDEGASELILGWSYLDLGALRIGTPSYFVLRRGAAVQHIAQPPARHVGRTIAP